MMKKSIYILTIVILIFGLSACKKEKPVTSSASTKTAKKKDTKKKKAKKKKDTKKKKPTKKKETKSKKETKEKKDPKKSAGAKSSENGIEKKTNSGDEEKDNAPGHDPGCTCGGGSAMVDVRSLEGLILPTVSNTDPPSYFEISQEDSIGAFVEGPMVEKALTDREFLLNDDMSVQSNASCDVGVYTTSYKEEVRQNITTCSPTSSECSTLAYQHTVINPKRLFDVTPHISCAWDKLEQHSFKVFIVNHEGHFVHVDALKPAGRLEVHFRKDSKSAKIYLNNLDPALDKPLVFENIDKDKVLKAKNDGLEVVLFPYSRDGEKANTVLGKITTAEGEFALAAIPHVVNRMGMFGRKH